MQKSEYSNIENFQDYLTKYWYITKISWASKANSLSLFIKKKCIYVENADWKKALLWMLEQSQLAVVRIGQGDGIFWELAAAFLLYPRDRILLVIDPNSVSDKQLADTYSNLSANLSATFELHFPERFNGSRVITFSKGGYATLHMAGVLTTLLTGNSFGMSIRKATKSIPEVTSFE